MLPGGARGRAPRPGGCQHLAGVLVVFASGWGLQFESARSEGGIKPRCLSSEPPDPGRGQRSHPNPMDAPGEGAPCRSTTLPPAHIFLSTSILKKGLKQLYFLKYSLLPAPPARSCQHPELTQPRGAAGGVLKATHPHPLLQHPMSTGTKEQSFHTSVPRGRWGFSLVSCYS